MLLRDYFVRQEQEALVEQVLQRAEAAPFYRPVMPRSGKPFSVDETNFGPLGWMSDVSGYRYAPLHPTTGHPWPDIPDALVELWRAVSDYPLPPQCCLVNVYRDGARMGLHQDRDEAANRGARSSRSHWAMTRFSVLAARLEKGRPEASALLRATCSRSAVRHG